MEEIEVYAVGGRRWGFVLASDARKLAVVYLSYKYPPAGWYYYFTNNCKNQYITSPSYRLLWAWKMAPPVSDGIEIQRAR